MYYLSYGKIKENGCIKLYCIKIYPTASFQSRLSQVLTLCKTSDIKELSIFMHITYTSIGLVQRGPPVELYPFAPVTVFVPVKQLMTLATANCLHKSTELLHFNTSFSIFSM